MCWEDHEVIEALVQAGDRVAMDCRMATALLFWLYPVEANKINAAQVMVLNAVIECRFWERYYSPPLDPFVNGHTYSAIVMLFACSKASKPQSRNDLYSSTSGVYPTGTFKSFSSGVIST